MTDEHSVNTVDELSIPFYLATVAEDRRVAIINYAVALIALGKTAGMDPATTAAWLHKKYVEAGWYDEFILQHGPGNLADFADEFVRGRYLLHERSTAFLTNDQLQVETGHFNYRTDFAACYFFGISPDDVEAFFDAVVEFHTRRIGIAANITRSIHSEVLTATSSAPAVPEDTDRSIHVRSAAPADSAWIRQVLEQRWGDVHMVHSGVAVDASEHSALIASLNGHDAGLLTYRIDDTGCEIISLDALVPMQGAGRALIQAVQTQAREATDCRKVFLITTNDNLPALYFYQRCGFRLSYVYPSAVASSRKIKNSIPEFGDNGLPVVDEIQLEWTCR